MPKGLQRSEVARSKLDVKRYRIPNRIRERKEKRPALRATAERRQDSRYGKRPQVSGDDTTRQVPPSSEHSTSQGRFEPPHYQKGTTSLRSIIRSTLTREQCIGFYRGNALKYLYRFRSLEDVRKALTYLSYLAEEMECNDGKSRKG